jgi:hypothetical protein
MLGACPEELSAEREERYQRLEAVSLAFEDFLVR